MVGNLEEWTADWVPRSAGCSPGGDWGAFSNDKMCLSGANTTADEPGVLIRGGLFDFFGTEAGPLAVIGILGPSVFSNGIGFRCAR